MTKFSIAIYGISFIIQILLVFFFPGAQETDSAVHISLAHKALEAGTWYPSVSNLEDTYICAPGLINYFIFLLKIFCSEKVILFANVLLMAGVSYFGYCLSKKVFGKNTAAMFLMLSALYPTTISMPLYALSELPYMFMLYASFFCCYQHNKATSALAGICIALANWVRPFLPVLVLTNLFILLNSNQKAKAKFLYSALMLASCTISICFIGATAKDRFGYFNYQSVTGGVNLIMGTTGAYGYEIFKEGNIGCPPPVHENFGSKRVMNVIEKDAYWKEQTVKYIRNNPWKWLSYIPKKAYELFASDYHAMGRMRSFFPRGSESAGWRCLYAVNQLYYMMLLLGALLAVFPLYRQRNISAGILLFFSVATIGITLATVGFSRYHYPFMPVVIMFAAYALHLLIKKYCRNLAYNDEQSA